MFDIFLSINNREQVIQLPVIPEKFMINRGMSNSEYESISQGQLKLIGQPKLKAITIDSFFPVKDYPYLRDRKYRGWEYVSMIESWEDRRIPIRLIIADTPINMACAIDDFDYGIQDGSGDIMFSLALSEFRFVKLR